MATVTKRGDSYRIKVSCGYDVNGKQVVQTRTWRPDPDMSARQIKKELDRQCVMFEEECKKGQVVATIKFETFAEQWFEEYAKINLRNTSFVRMKQLTDRVYPAIGHLRLDKITGRHIQQFVNDLINSTSERTGKPLARKTVVHHLSFISDGICPISNIPPIFFSALLYPECTAFLPNLHTRQKHGTGTDALRKL